MDSLALLAEVGPITGHRLVQGQLSPFGQQVNQQGHERFARGESPEQRTRFAVDGPVEHHVAVPEYAQLCGDAPRPDKIERPGEACRPYAGLVR